MGFRTTTLIQKKHCVRVSVPFPRSCHICACYRGIGTAAAMAAAHLGPERGRGSSILLMRMRKFRVFQLVRSLVRSGRGQYFKRYSKLSTMTRDAKVSSCFFFFFCGEFIVSDCSSARKLGLTPFTEDPRTFKIYKSNS